MNTIATLFTEEVHSTWSRYLYIGNRQTQTNVDFVSVKDHQDGNFTFIVQVKRLHGTGEWGCSEIVLYHESRKSSLKSAMTEALRVHNEYTDIANGFSS